MLWTYSIQSIQIFSMNSRHKIPLNLLEGTKINGNMAPSYFKRSVLHSFLGLLEYTHLNHLLSGQMRISGMTFLIFYKQLFMKCKKNMTRELRTKGTPSGNFDLFFFPHWTEKASLRTLQKPVRI